MASTVFPAPSAASKTAFRTTLTSGTSYTVPAGVTYLNVKLFSGGRGGASASGGVNGPDGRGGQVITSTLTCTPGASITYAIGAGGAADTNGGNTTFTGATTATGGALTGTTGEGAGNGGAGGHSGMTAAQSGGAGKIEIEYWV